MPSRFFGREADRCSIVTADARALIDEALREGRGVVFASAHLGPWERVAASLVAAGFPLTTIARESYDPRFTRLYERLRGSRGVRVVWRSPAPDARRNARGDHRAGEMAATVGIVRTLRRGGVLGVPMDLRSRVPSCETPFLGHAATTPVGPARIALRTGAAVVVGTVAPLRGLARHHGHAHSDQRLRFSAGRGGPRPHGAHQSRAVASDPGSAPRLGLDARAVDRPYRV